MKSLTLASQVKSLASKPASPRKCPVLSSRTALFFYLLKMGQGHDQFCFVLSNARELAKSKFEDISFPRERLNFPENFQIFGAKTFFFRRSLLHCVLGPWPGAFLSLASKGSVLGRAVLGLDLVPFFLDSTFADYPILMSLVLKNSSACRLSIVQYFFTF